MSWLEHTTEKNLTYFHQKLDFRTHLWGCYSVKYKKRETGKVGSRKPSLWRSLVSTEQTSFCANRNYPCGHQPFESPAWTEVHSLSQFCLCPDVYNSWASSHGSTSFPVTHMGWWLEAQSQLGEGCTFSISVSTLAHLPGFSFPNLGWEQGPGYEHSIFYSCASLQIKWMQHSILQPREMGMRLWAQRAPRQSSLV